MDSFVFAAVLFAAACHAGWNSLIKVRLEPLLSVTLIAIACGIVAAPALPFLPWPGGPSWPYLLTSAAIHFFYNVWLGMAYRAGDFGQVYPIARGTGPLITAIATTVLLGEQLGGFGWLGVLLLASGVMALSLKGGRTAGAIDVRAVGFALATAVTIGAYSVTDGVGSRLSGAPFSYALWLFFLDGLIMAAFGFWRWGRALVAEGMKHWLTFLLAGVMSTAAYAIALWAMTKAPIALVAALRESSVLFAAVIGVVFLREPVIGLRIVAGVIVLAGMVLLRLRDVL